MPPRPIETPPEPLPKEQVAPTPNRKHLARLLILAGLAILLVWLALTAWRVYQASRSLMALPDEAQALLAGGAMNADVNQIEALAGRARADVVMLNRELALFRPLAPLLGWVPKAGPLIVAGPHLLDMADAGTEAGVLALRGLKPAMAAAQSDDFGMSKLGELLPTLETAAPDLAAAQAALGRYQTARDELGATVSAETLPWRVQELLKTADANVPLARQGLELIPYLPALLGTDGPKRYLILAQNEDELRPTGGFLTGAGLVTVEDGRITDLQFQDANGVDNWKDKPYDVAPAPLYEFMLSELYLFRDANFWPDFPTSAGKAMALYAYGQDVPLPDGAIAIDQEFLRLLVEVVGPIPVEGTDQSITADNLIKTLRSARDPQEGQEVREWVQDRKAFLAGFAGAIQGKLENDFGSIDPVYLGRQMLHALQSRHAQVYIPEPEVAGALARLGWDGRLPAAPPGDFWAAVDTNMGFNKVNVFIDRSLAYEVDLGAPQGPVGTLTVNYRHTGEKRDDPCFQGVEKEFEEGAGYLALANKCYWNYLRVYVPAASQLLDSTTSLVPGETLFSGQMWERPAQPVAEFDRLTTFANFLLVPQSGAATAAFRYQMPAAVLQQDGDEMVYSLTVQKQAGTRPEPLSLSIKLPPGATLVSASPEPSAGGDGALAYTLPLEENMTFTVRFR